VNDPAAARRLLPRPDVVAAAAQVSGSGAPGVIRTPGLRFRKPSLYPPELRGPEEDRAKL